MMRMSVMLMFMMSQVMVIHTRKSWMLAKSLMSMIVTLIFMLITMLVCMMMLKIRTGIIFVNVFLHIRV